MPNPQNLKGKGFKERPENINKTGRPKKLPPLDELMERVMGKEKDGVSAMEVILMALRAKAAKGDVRAAELLLDRKYGKAKQTMDLSVTVPQIKVNASSEANQQIENL